ncbi:MAG: hypothetical protein M1318_00295 [Firmicutes bacterium]|jgi:hypothetical protein|nr:hypothetical protein [Bacillota bacterium]
MIRDLEESFIVTGYPSMGGVVMTTIAPITYSIGLLINLGQLMADTSTFTFESADQ